MGFTVNDIMELLGDADLEQKNLATQIQGLQDFKEEARDGIRTIIPSYKY